MEIVTPQPSAYDLWSDNWTLLADGPSTYLHVQVEISAVTVTRMIRLTEPELEEKRLIGWVFLHYLARRIHERRDDYAEREVTGPIRDAAEEALRRRIGA